MDIILLERVGGLGSIGDVVTVKDGYARNFLLPQKKALRANEANKKKFEGQRAQLEARNLERKTEVIATLKTLGADNRTIFQVYFLQIAALTLAGLFAGLALAILPARAARGSSA